MGLPKIKNLILLIGDGMGPAHIKAYRQFKRLQLGDNSASTLFDKYLIGSVATDPIGGLGDITDSAASATAYATGSKTLNGVLSLDEKGQPLKTLVEVANEQGMRTGLVATSQLVHATPAAFASHCASRESTFEIADQFATGCNTGKPMVDVLLGGGRRYFDRDDKNLLALFQEHGYTLFNSRQSLLKGSSLHEAPEKVLGLFAEEGLPFVLERDASIPSLAEMTLSALRSLGKHDSGYFLMVEGSQIDWASHNNDIHSVMQEMQCFEAAFAEVLKVVESREDTLVLLTADHETGGLTLGRRVNDISAQSWNPKVLQRLKYSPLQLAQQLVLMPSKDREHYWVEQTDVELNNADKKLLESFELESDAWRWVLDVININTRTGWGTGAHTGVDVLLYGAGAGVENYRGHLNNHELGAKMKALLQSVTSQSDNSPLKIVNF